MWSWGVESWESQGELWRGLLCMVCDGVCGIFSFSWGVVGRWFVGFWLGVFRGGGGGGGGGEEDVSLTHVL